MHAVHLSTSRCPNWNMSTFPVTDKCILNACMHEVHPACGQGNGARHEHEHRTVIAISQEHFEPQADAWILRWKGLGWDATARFCRSLDNCRGGPQILKAMGQGFSSFPWFWRVNASRAVANLAKRAQKGTRLPFSIFSEGSSKTNFWNHLSKPYTATFWKYLNTFRNLRWVFAKFY